MPASKTRRRSTVRTKSLESERKERVLKTFGKFEHVATSSEMFSKKKKEEADREDRSHS